MKKDKEWLKEEVRWLCHSKVLQSITINVDVLDNLINQLEEPEQDKVVIPQFVADWIEECREMDVRLGESFNTHYEDNREIHTWIYNSDDKNSEIYARAWLDGYTVEKEKLYRVVLNHKQILWQATDGSGDIDIISRNRITTGKTKFAEQEIKAIDERYWAFAEEVTK